MSKGRWKRYRGIEEKALKFIRKLEKERKPPTTNQVAKYLGVFFYTAKKILEELERQGKVRSITFGQVKDGRVWLLARARGDEHEHKGVGR